MTSLAHYVCVCVCVSIFIILKMKLKSSFKATLYFAFNKHLSEI